MGNNILIATLPDYDEESLYHHVDGYEQNGDAKADIESVLVTGKVLGTGVYGVVVEMEVNGQLCAGKVIRRQPLNNADFDIVREKFVQESQLLSTLDHPNVIKYLGMYNVPSLSDYPVLVMERLEKTLHVFIEQTPKCNFSLQLKQSILQDIARGLNYLHNKDPPIIHRDLTAGNILLTLDNKAKLSDLGNSHIMDPKSQQLTTVSGTHVYMPPEAFFTPPHCDYYLDIFSFGHLTLYIALQKFPDTLLPTSYQKESKLVVRSEIERREEYFHMLEEDLPSGKCHPFVHLIKWCLQNDPLERPTSGELQIALQSITIEDEELLQ